MSYMAAFIKFEYVDPGVYIRLTVQLNSSLEIGRSYGKKEVIPRERCDLE